jgi:signal peptidase I
MAVMDNAPAKSRKPWISVLLSLTSPGLGHIDNGNLKQGFIIYATVMVSAITAYTLWAYVIPNLFVFLLLVIAGVIAQIKIALHAAQQSRHLTSDIWRPWQSRPMGLIVLFLISTFILEPVVSATGKSIAKSYKIPGDAMNPTLLIGDHIPVKQAYYGINLPFANHLLVEFSSPQRGDVIVFKYPEDESKDFIKRVIGLPGDRVEIRHQQAYINDQPLTEPYAVHLKGVPADMALRPRDEFGPVIVPADSYFVLGDNRDYSLDSRYWGFVKVEEIMGQAYSIYWSWNSDDSNSDDSRVRWERIGKEF